MSTDDDACSGFPKKADTDDNIKKVHKIILNEVDRDSWDSKDIKGTCWTYREWIFGYASLLK